MRIGFAPWGETIEELVEAARAAENAGAHTIWVSELHRSSTIQAAAVAAATTRVRIGTGIALAFTRSPVVTALEAMDLTELSAGRFVLGLGSGTRRVNEEWHNRPFEHPAPRLAEVVRGIRGFWQQSSSGDPIVVDGEYAPIRISGYRRPYQAPEQAPIYIAAVGPAMTRLSARIGDGWLAHELCSPRFVAERVLPELHAGWKRPLRPTEFDVTASLCCSISPDAAVAADRITGHVGFYATVRAYNEFFAFHGLEDEHRRIVDEFRETKRAPRASREMSDLLTASGDADAVAARVREYEGLADSIKLSVPVNGLRPEEIRDAQENLIGLIERIADAAADT